MEHKIVECDNCGAEYIAFDTDKNRGPICHRVCDTCYMPMKVINPFYNGPADLKDGFSF